MRITSKGQVTIPVHLRQKAGLMSHAEVDFMYDGPGAVRIVRARPKGKATTRGRRIVAQLRGRGDVAMTTDEIMALTRNR
jgi:bifunctional DNA-binding transcriptional regulator/antitoxin component of YhaV-PrlF toxin-antitoxin module